MKYFITLIVVIILIGGFWVWQGIYYPVSPDSDETVIFLVKKGEGAKEISINLKEQGLIRYGSFFRVYVLFKEVGGDLKAGEYELSRAMAIPEIVNKLASGDRIKKIIIIIEGWNLEDIRNYLEEKGIAKAKELDPSLEGYLFPDTYEISPEDGIEEIVEKMLDNFDKKLTSELREEISSQGKTVHEIVIIASLLEKEVRTFKDKKIVAGILWKRLESNMLLQVDATITYITGRKTTKILKEELQIDSPYNTYKYKGLPLGPISNPGLESILAAIYPQESQYLYYLSTPEGETIFSRTLKEHNEAKAKYLK
ncbi:endolytic transglycosylase MltG [Patescibacteria group bacterium]|nr:endolytic transglycosylase MltG [Patescibacteria group bacterium]